MKTIQVDRATFTVKPEHEAEMRAALAKASKVPSPKAVQAKFASRRDSRKYPRFVEGTSTADYVRDYFFLNGQQTGYGIQHGSYLSVTDKVRVNGEIDRFFAPLSTNPQYTQGEIA